MTVFKCVPPCKSCREADVCDRAMAPSDAEDIAVKARGNLYPKDLIALPCGCLALPWPLVHKMGDAFDRIWCEDHGEQNITKAYLKKAVAKSRTMMARELIGSQATLFPEEPPF